MNVVILSRVIPDLMSCWKVVLTNEGVGDTDPGQFLGAG